MYLSFAQFLIKFLIVDFKELLVYFGYNYFFGYLGCKYFSQSVVCLLALLIVSYTEQVLLILMNSNLSFFFFIDGAFSVYLKTHTQTDCYTDSLL